MFTPRPITTAFIVATEPDVEERLHGLLALLIDAGIVITAVTDPAQAIEIITAGGSDVVPCVLIDVTRDDAPAIAGAFEAIRAIAAVPDLKPIMLTAGPSAELVIQGVRTGAADVIDMNTDLNRRVTEILQGVSARCQEQAERRNQVRQLKAMVEDFFRAQSEQGSAEPDQRIEDLAKPAAARGKRSRRPMVLLVTASRLLSGGLIEHLSMAGMATEVALSGELALRRINASSERGSDIDLVVVDERLPGMNGIETVEEIGKAAPWLTALFLTEAPPAVARQRVAKLGIAGYVSKPCDDMDAVTQQIKDAAVQGSQNKGQDHRYQEQIKQRRDKLLTHYRTLAADLDEV